MAVVGTVETVGAIVGLLVVGSRVGPLSAHTVSVQPYKVMPWQGFACG